MPKVLRIINRFNLGGPTYNAAYLSKYLAPDYETLLIGGEKDDTEESSLFIPHSLGLEPLIIPEMRREINWANDRAAYKKLKQIIKDFKPDIVHTHAAKAGTLGRLAAHDAGVKVILHTFHGHVFHSYFGNAKTFLFKQIERYLAKRSTKIIAISEVQKHELTNIHRICPADKIVVIPLGFDLNRFAEESESKRKKFRQEFNVADDELVIAIVGRLVPVKNHNLFLDALKSLLSESQLKVRAFIVGDGESRQQIENYAMSLDIPYTTRAGEAAPLTFTSWRTDVDVVYAGADMVALSSLNEGTPVSLIEAQAAGKAVISTRVGGIENVMLENETGFLCSPTDKTDFTNKFKELALSEDKRLAFSQKAKANVWQRYSYQRLVSDMKNLYDSLLRS